MTDFYTILNKSPNLFQRYTSTILEKVNGGTDKLGA